VGATLLDIKAVSMEFPADANIIVGQSHFIKTVEDLDEAVITTVPQAKFGLAFNESSGACLTRVDGKEDGLRDTAFAFWAAPFALLLTLRADSYRQTIILDRNLSDRVAAAQVNIGALTRDELHESITVPRSWSASNSNPAYRSRPR
jgi:hypothetical protein